MHCVQHTHYNECMSSLSYNVKKYSHAKCFGSIVLYNSVLSCAETGRGHTIAIFFIIIPHTRGRSFTFHPIKWELFVLPYNRFRQGQQPFDSVSDWITFYEWRDEEKALRNKATPFRAFAVWKLCAEWRVRSVNLNGIKMSSHWKQIK